MRCWVWRVGTRRRGTIRKSIRDRGVTGEEEIQPRRVQGGAEVWLHSRSEDVGTNCESIRRKIKSMLAGWDRKLVLVSFSVLGIHAFGEPIRGAIESDLGVQVDGTLSISYCPRADVDSCRTATITAGRKRRIRFVLERVVLVIDVTDLSLREKWILAFEPSVEVRFRSDIRHYEALAFVGVVTRQDAVAVESAQRQLLARCRSQEVIVSHGYKAGLLNVSFRQCGGENNMFYSRPRAKRQAGRIRTDKTAGRLQRVRVHLTKAIQNCTVGWRRIFLVVARVASSAFGKLQVVVIGYFVPVVVLRWRERGGSDTLLEQLRALFATVGHGLSHDTTSSSGLTQNGDCSGISSELMDMLLYPLESKVLVHEPSIEAAMVVNVVAGQEAERG